MDALPHSQSFLPHHSSHAFPFSTGTITTSDYAAFSSSNGGCGRGPSPSSSSFLYGNGVFGEWQQKAQPQQPQPEVLSLKDHEGARRRSNSSSSSGGSNSKRRGVGSGSGVKLSTDPQSVAARERRHRISDRFKILQSLVPGGSKMDTVSMLEEAIHYVKFLKAQIWLHHALMATPAPLSDVDPLISQPVSASAVSLPPSHFIPSLVPMSNGADYSSSMVSNTAAPCSTTSLLLPSQQSFPDMQLPSHLETIPTQLPCWSAFQTDEDIMLPQLPSFGYYAS